MVSGIDEEAVLAPTLEELVVALAAEKAGAVADLPEVDGAVVIGCDSLLDVDGEVHGKPASVDHARAPAAAGSGAAPPSCAPATA